MRTKRHWFSLIAGIFFLACSIFMFANPSAPLTALGIFFSIIVFIGGVLETIRSFFTPASTRSVWSLISAIITVLVGVLLLSASAAAQAAFIPVIVGVWMIIVGLSRLSAGRRATYLSSGAGKHMVFSGVVPLILGILICLFPVVFGSVVVWLIALALLLVGMVCIGDFFVSRKANRPGPYDDGIIDVEAR